MKLITWEPRTDLAKVRRQLDSLFESFFTPSLRLNADAWNPVCRAGEDDKEYTITIELPGVDEKDIAVELAGNQLSIIASRTSSTKEKDRSESWTGSFARTVSLPETIDLAKIEASHVKGLLIIKLPKLPQPKAKAIAIKTA